MNSRTELNRAEVAAGERGHNDDAFDLTLLDPCRSEEHRIQGTLETIDAAMRESSHSSEVSVIDDGFSREVQNYIDKLNEPIRLVTHKTNRGLTRTYVDGAFMGRGIYYRQVCGDNVEPEETLIASLSQLGKADTVIPYHGEVAGKSSFRKWISNFYTTLVNTLSGYRIRYYTGIVEGAAQASRDAASFGLFGSSIAATWLSDVLGDRVSFFVEEGDHRIGHTHLGRPILGVSQVPPGRTVFVPLIPRIARQVVTRLQTYPNRVFLPPHPGGPDW